MEKKDTEIRVTVTPMDGTLPTLLTTKELQTYLRLSRNSAVKFGRTCGAERRAGGVSRWDVNDINEGLRHEQTNEEAGNVSV